MSAAVDRVARLGACALLRGLFLPGLLAAAVPPAPGAEATNRYEFREQHDPDGIGKFFMGREIAWVMGHEGADWLERPERDREEHTTDLVALLDLQPGQVVAHIGAGTGYFTRQMAPRLGSSGKVLAVDVQPEMLGHVQSLSAQSTVTRARRCPRLSCRNRA